MLGPGLRAATAPLNPVSSRGHADGELRGRVALGGHTAHVPAFPPTPLPLPPQPTPQAGGLNHRRLLHTLWRLGVQGQGARGQRALLAVSSPLPLRTPVLRVRALRGPHLTFSALLTGPVSRLSGGQSCDL